MVAMAVARVLDTTASQRRTPSKKSRATTLTITETTEAAEYLTSFWPWGVRRREVRSARFSAMMFDRSGDPPLLSFATPSPPGKSPGGRSARAHRHVGPLLRTDVQLPRPVDLGVLLDELLPVGQPTGHPGDGEQHGEHLRREAHGLVDEARVEVDVGIQLAGDEVLVRQGDLFELQGHVEERVFAGDGEHLVGRALDDFGPGVVVLVHPVAEALEQALAPLDVGDEGVHVVDRLD